MEHNHIEWLKLVADCSCCKWEYNYTGRCNSCEERCNFEFKERK